MFPTLLRSLANFTRGLVSSRDVLKVPSSCYLQGFFHHKFCPPGWAKEEKSIFSSSPTSVKRSFWNRPPLYPSLVTPLPLLPTRKFFKCEFRRLFSLPSSPPPTSVSPLLTILFYFITPTNSSSSVEVSCQLNWIMRIHIWMLIYQTFSVCRRECHVFQVSRWKSLW